MSLDYLVAPVAILLVIAAITLVSFGISGLRNGRKRQGAWLLAGGILMVVVPVGATAAWNAYREWASWEHTVSVQGLDPTGAPEFAVDIRHQAGYSDSSTYNFAEAGDLLQAANGADPQDPYGAGRATHLLSDFLEAHAFQVAQHDDFAVTGRETGELIGQHGGGLAAIGLGAGGGVLGNQRCFEFRGRVVDVGQTLVQRDLAAGVAASR